MHDRLLALLFFTSVPVPLRFPPSPSGPAGTYMKFRHPEGWTVGLLCDGRWTPLSDHSSEQEAEQLLSALCAGVLRIDPNGGASPAVHPLPQGGRYSEEDTPMVMVPLSVVDLYALMAVLQRALSLNASCANCNTRKIRWFRGYFRHHLLRQAQRVIPQWLTSSTAAQRTSKAGQ